MCPQWNKEKEEKAKKNTTKEATKWAANKNATKQATKETILQNSPGRVTRR
jgi:hypothetical protein